MLDRDPAPEGFEGRCIYCGRQLVEPGSTQDVPKFQGGVEVAVRFCSDVCEKAYRSLTDEDWEELEEILRAGAT